MKEKALARLAPPDITLRRFRAPDTLKRLPSTLQLCTDAKGFLRLPTGVPEANCT